jgi:chromosome segregation ATPase
MADPTEPTSALTARIASLESALTAANELVDGLKRGQLDLQKCMADADRELEQERTLSAFNGERATAAEERAGRAEGERDRYGRDLDKARLAAGMALGEANRERDSARAKLAEVERERDECARISENRRKSRDKLADEVIALTAKLAEVERSRQSAEFREREFADLLQEADTRASLHLTECQRLRSQLAEHRAVVEAARKVSAEVDEYQGDNDDLFRLIAQKCEAPGVSMALNDLQVALVAVDALPAPSESAGPKGGEPSAAGKCSAVWRDGRHEAYVAHETTFCRACGVTLDSGTGEEPTR